MSAPVEKLELCPFCGGEAFADDRNIDGHFMHFIACHKCGARTGFYGHRGAAEDAWARRPAAQPVAQEADTAAIALAKTMVANEEHVDARLVILSKALLALRPAPALALPNRDELAEFICELAGDADWDRSPAWSAIYRERADEFLKLANQVIKRFSLPAARDAVLDDAKRIIQDTTFHNNLAALRSELLARIDALKSKSPTSASGEWM